MAAKRGRPRGLNLNPVAIEDLLRDRCVSKQELCDGASISPGHLADMLRRGKGVSPASVRAMADFLRVSPATIAPELTPGFVFVRADDDLAVPA